MVQGERPQDRPFLLLTHDMGPARWGVRKAATYLAIVLPVALALYRFPFHDFVFNILL